MATNVPSTKLTLDFGWMLDRISEGLDISECRRIAIAENLPKSKISDSENFRTTLLSLLRERRRFGPLELDGLIEILQNVKRENLIDEVEQYKGEQRYKEEREQYKKQKGKYRQPQSDEMKEIGQQIATFKSKLLLMVKAVLEAEDDFEKFKTGEKTIDEVRKSLDKCLERPTMKSTLSNSGIGSTHFPTEEDHYSELPGPTEETERDMAPLPTDTPQNPIKKHKQPLPVPVHYKKRTSGARKIESTPIPPNQAEPFGNTESDLTGGTGDSGVGTGESERNTWIKNSAEKIAQEFKTSSPGPPVKPRQVKPKPVISPPKKGHYTDLIGRNEPQGGYTKPIRADSMDNLLSELKQRQDNL